MSNNIRLQDLITRLTTLKQGGVPTGKALNKPVMILALIDILETGVTPECIPINADLKKHFEKIWLLLIPNVKTGDFFMPVLHLPNEGFWNVYTSNKKPVAKKYSSINGAEKDGLWSRFNDEFVDLIQLQEVREIVRMTVLDTYFPSTKRQFWETYGQPELIAAGEPLLWVKEAAPRYIRRVKFTLFEGYVRHWQFRENVLQIYDHTCCISGLKTQKGRIYPLVDACHIEQHAVSGIDNLNNGLALCKNLHAAFDAGLISLTSDYRVLVTSARDFHESDSPYNLRHLIGKSIRLPYTEQFYPAEQYLAAHRSRWGFK